MFRPRQAYKPSITKRYRGKAKGCPVFNNLNEITSSMVEQHDECLECLASMKNRTDLYRTLADNNKPNNNVIKSLQRLSSSASNNRLKTCLQFLIIKVNEKTISKKQTLTAETKLEEQPAQETELMITNEDLTTLNRKSHHLDRESQECNSIKADLDSSQTKQTHKQRLHKGQSKDASYRLAIDLSSPPQDQVSSTQDQVVPEQDEHDCQTSPMELETTQLDEPVIEPDQIEEFEDPKGDCINHNGPCTKQEPPIIPEITIEPATSLPDEIESNLVEPMCASTIPSTNSVYLIPVTTTSPSTIESASSLSTSPAQIESPPLTSGSNTSSNTSSNGTPKHKIDIGSQINPNTYMIAHKKPKISPTTNHHIEHDNFSTTSWSSSYESPPSPISTSSISSESSDDSMSTISSASSFCSSVSENSKVDQKQEHQQQQHQETPKPTFLESNNELRCARLKLSNDKIRKIKKRPISFDDYYFDRSSIASTPTTNSTSDNSPGQHSNCTQNSDLSRLGGLAQSINPVIHQFQAPPLFMNTLKPCSPVIVASNSNNIDSGTGATININPNKQETQPPPSNRTLPTKEMLNCAICGIKDKPANIRSVYGQNSCVLCTRFFGKFLKKPLQLYCAQDGDCLMTFDSRCQACWIKICLQKFHVEEDHRKIGQKFSPKLLSSPNVPLITIDTSLPRH